MRRCSRSWYLTAPARQHEARSRATRMNCWTGTKPGSIDFNVHHMPWCLRRPSFPPRRECCCLQGPGRTRERRLSTTSHSPGVGRTLARLPSRARHPLAQLLESASAAFVQQVCVQKGGERTQIRPSRSAHESQFTCQFDRIARTRLDPLAACTQHHAKRHVRQTHGILREAGHQSERM